jgi:hypothetical protein
MKKWIELAFDIGDEIYIKTDSEQKKRIVISIWLKQNGVTYELGQGSASSWHYDFEMTKEPNMVTKVTYEKE